MIQQLPTVYLYLNECKDQVMQPSLHVFLRKCEALESSNC